MTTKLLATKKTKSRPPQAIYLRALLLALAFVSGCGEKTATDRRPGAGELAPASNAGTESTEKPNCSVGANYGSQQDTEIQGVKPDYVVPVGSALVQISLKQLSKLTTKEFVFSTMNNTIAIQKFEARYNTAVIRVNVKGASEGIHIGRITALYQDGSESDGVLLRLRVGQSTTEVTKSIEPENPEGTSSTETGGAVEAGGASATGEGGSASGGQQLNFRPSQSNLADTCQQSY